MVQMAAPAFVTGDRFPLFLRLLSRASVRRLLGALPPTERAAAGVLRNIGHGASLDAGRIPAALLTWYVEMQRTTDTMHNDGEMIGRLLPHREELRLTDDLLAEARVPTLYWWGADDAFGGEDVARHLVDVMPDATLTMVPDAGHLPWLDDPAGAADATASFLLADAPRPVRG
jgi:pimeloyl-ACP methyl ester carboxylesterase